MTRYLLYFLAFLLGTANADGGRCPRSKTVVKPRFQCYDDVNGVAIFGYRAFSRDPAFTTFSITDPADNRVVGALDVTPITTFRVGCWSNAFAFSVQPNQARKVFWAVGTEKAQVNFRRLCSRAGERGFRSDDHDNEDRECPPLPCLVNSCPEDVFEACRAQNMWPEPGNNCKCTPYGTATITLPLTVVGDITSYYANVEQYVTGGATFYSNLLNSAGLKTAVAGLINQGLGAALTTCLEPSDVIISEPVITSVGADPNVPLQLDIVVGFWAWASLSSADYAGLLTTGTTQASWDNLVTSADAALCDYTGVTILHTATDAQLDCLDAPVWYSDGCCLPGWTCSQTQTCLSSTNCYNIDGCLQATPVGPAVFGSTYGVLALIDEEGRVKESAEMKLGPRAGADGYLALSPAYLVVALAVVVALAMGSIVGVVVYRRRHTDSSALPSDEASDGMWKSATSKSGRTRAGGVVN